MNNAILLILLISAASVRAESPDLILKRYESEARKMTPGFKTFSAERGQQLYVQKGTGPRSTTSCATCHGIDPRQAGRTRANKVIETLVPALNPKRFTDPAHVEKWFTRNCDDVLSRPCTPLEKGDFITWLLTLQ